MNTLETRDYGVIEYDEADLILFPDGLFGFPELRKYVPLSMDEENDNTILLVQSIENPDIAFAVINPFSLDPGYSPRLSKEELSYLNVRDEGDLSFYCIVVLRKNYLDNTVNLKAPLVINPETRTGLQVILENSGYDYRKSLSSFMEGSC